MMKQSQIHSMRVERMKMLFQFSQFNGCATVSDRFSVEGFIVQLLLIANVRLEKALVTRLTRSKLALINFIPNLYSVKALFA